ncbi:MAG: S23 ribosomal protein [candidate division CPR1 bacterium GW2011_GWA2_42_17]|uniref:S23 ribosomal protein n=1 Tax=candidate division CPR1 bacterium GW2011_GWA2_42_17 TaxID=1618341 RepID=A0A0G0Z6I5_9BACT|nr:MAG: S23 ribosomal protein [candidate division CPR1 bacterium GW2011_GWA2_42_17]
MINNYRKLQVWEKAVELVEKIYKITEKFPDNEKFGLISQMRRASISIPSNIAEGKIRAGDTEFRRFLLIAFGSGAELETQIEISKRLSYCSEEETANITVALSEVMKMLNSLIQKLDASS